MRVLLLGEYSRLHNSLKEGLVALGHEVLIVGDGDLFKNYPVDVDLSPKLFNKSFLFRKFRVFVNKLTGIDLGLWESYFRLKKQLPHLQNFDVVQCINSSALKIPLSKQKKVLQQLKNHNKLLWYCACGTDTRVVDALLADCPGHHILTPLHLGNYTKTHFKYEFNYVQSRYRKYYQFFEECIDGITASDWDYAPVYLNNPKFFGLIPNPINTDKIKVQYQEAAGVVHIFLGINNKSAHKKGHDLLQKAMRALHQKYPDKIRLIFAENMPYNDYIKQYLSAHIFMDMTYAKDQGYNALEAMAAGKVVFTGAGKDFLKHYQLTEDSVCINTPTAERELLQKMETLIEKPDQLDEISKNARAFIETHHHYVKVAETYVKTWQSQLE